MSDIDLIPSAWRARRTLARELRSWLVAATLLVVAVAGARLWLWQALDSLRPQVAGLRQAQARASAGHAEALQLVERRRVLGEQARALDRLHVGRSVGLIDTALQSALNDQVWLQELAYVRGDHLSLRGGALSHAALAAFVDALAHQPGIDDVHIIGTAGAELPGLPALQFELAAAVRLPPGAAP